MRTDPNQLELDLDLPPREGRTNAREQESPNAPSGRSRDRANPPVASNSRVRETLSWRPIPKYVDLSEAPEHLVEHAIRKMLPWVQEFVFRGFQPRQLRKCAEANAARKSLPKTAIPKVRALFNWAFQYRDYGVLGLVAVQEANAIAERVSRRSEVSRG